MSKLRHREEKELSPNHPDGRRASIELEPTQSDIRACTLYY